MVKKKGQSKRLSLHKKYKILRKVREHKRKVRKTEKNGLGKKAKVPGIPNNWPFKEDLMLQVEQERLREIEHQKELMEAKRDQKKEAKQQQMDALNSLSNVPDVTPKRVEMQAKQQLASAVNEADMVFVVLDARDPQGCRSLSLEDGLIAKGDKKVVLILNKVDLIPQDLANKWLKYLRRFHPTIPTRSVNEVQKKINPRTRRANEKQSHALYEKRQQFDQFRDNGQVNMLREFLSGFDTTCSTKTSSRTKVAIIGYGNTGKSSLFNALLKQPVAETSEDVNTKECIEAPFGNHVTLVDCPPLRSECSAMESSLMRLCIARSYEVDPVSSIQEILARGDMMNLLQNLKIPPFKSHEDFLAKYATKMGLLRKGGSPNILLGARAFLKSLGTGSHAFFCDVPSKSKKGFKMPTWFTKINTEKIAELEEKLLASLPACHSMTMIRLESQKVSHERGDTLEYDIAMGEDMQETSEEDADSSEEEDSLSGQDEVEE